MNEGKFADRLEPFPLASSTQIISLWTESKLYFERKVSSYQQQSMEIEIELA